MSGCRYALSGISTSVHFVQLYWLLTYHQLAFDDGIEDVRFIRCSDIVGPLVSGMHQVR